jgi:hypothetical protein
MGPVQFRRWQHGATRHALLSQVLSSIRRKEKPVRLRADGFVKVIPLRTEKVRPPDVLIDENCVIGVEPGPLNAAMIARLTPAATELWGQGNNMEQMGVMND